MKKIIFIIFALGILPILAASGVKVVYIPDNIEVEENVFKATTIRNLSEIEIYQPYPINIIGNYIYLATFNSSEVIKLSLKGEIISRMGRKGQGPGEFVWVWTVERFNENLAIIDEYKVVISDRNLKVLKEIRFGEGFNGLTLTKNHQIYLYDNPRSDEYYFSLYTEDFKFLRKFAKRITTPKENMKRRTWDYISCILYVPEENGIWASFQNRYDLRYYKDERLDVEIKTEKFFFSGKKTEHMGETIIVYTDRSVLLARYKNRLFYFFNKGKNFFCDVFYLAANNKFQRRIKLTNRYRSLAHHKGYTFYGLRYDSIDKENVILEKIEIKKIKQEVKDAKIKSNG